MEAKMTVMHWIGAFARLVRTHALAQTNAGCTQCAPDWRTYDTPTLFRRGMRIAALEDWHLSTSRQPGREPLEDR
jgi:hypothetical protein